MLAKAGIQREGKERGLDSRVKPDYDKEGVVFFIHCDADGKSA